MSKRFNFFLAPLLFLIFASCKLISFEEFNARISILEGQNYYDKEFLELDFSPALEKKVAENFIALKEDGASCQTETLWSGNKCLIKAAGGFKKGFKYSFAFKGLVLTEDGRNYNVDIRREFIFGKESEMFFATEIQEPQKNSNENQGLTFKFNKEADKGVFERSLAISPAIDCKKIWSPDGKTVEVFPAEKWKANILYNWRLEKLLSQDGTKISKSYSGTFMAVEKSQAPKLLRACPAIDGIFYEKMDLNSLLERQALGIEFDSEMNFESLKNGIYWTPFVDGFWTQIDKKRFIFAPSQNYKAGTEFLMTISESVEDVFGIKIAESENIKFTPRTEFISLEVFCAGAKKGENEIQKLRLEKGIVNKIEILEGSPLIIIFEFSKALDKRAVASFKNAARMQRLFPLDAAQCNLDSIDWTADSSLENCRSIQMEWSGFDFSTSEEEIIYELKVNGGENFIYNRFGEFLKEDECFYISLKERAQL